jgi:hypothetical protein
MEATIENTLFAPVSLCDMDTDLLKIIIPCSMAMRCRCVCRRLKATLELMPGTVIILSKRGSDEATQDFFAKFLLPTIGSSFGWNLSSGWFCATLARLETGMSLNGLVLHTTDQNLPQIIEILDNSLTLRPNSIQRLRFDFEGSASQLQRCAASLRELSTKSTIELSARISYDLHGDQTLVLLSNFFQTLAASVHCTGLDARCPPPRRLPSRQPTAAFFSCAIQYKIAPHSSLSEFSDL